MIVFKDLFTNSEMFTDACNVKDEGTHFTFESKYVTRTSGEIDESLIGGNASVEEAAEQSESASTSGLDFVLDNRLQEDFSYADKKAFMAELKPYLKLLKAKIMEQKDIKSEDDPHIGEFMKRANVFFKEVVAKQFADLNLFFGEFDEEHSGTCCFTKFHDDGSGATVYVFKDGVVQEKY